MRLSKFINKHFLKKEEDTVDVKYTVENINKDKTKDNLQIGDILWLSLSTTIKENGKKKRLNNRKDIYRLVSIYGKFVFEDFKGNQYYTSKTGIKIPQVGAEAREEAINQLLDEHETVLKEEAEAKYLESLKKNGINFKGLPPEGQLKKLATAGIKNIWMVGPAGCGKSTMARNLAESMQLPYLCISCGIGTSATEFIGYKYPTREKTRFGDFYSKPSVILIDEITALDPAVAQILNAALANDEIETTTGLVQRDPKCIIIATSNTFGFGCDRQYVANNQLDASTIDRFIGGIIEVSYSEQYESQYDKEVVEFVKTLRRFTNSCDIRKVLSTRMIQAGHRLKRLCFIKDWQKVLLSNWSDIELKQLKDWCREHNIILRV